MNPNDPKEMEAFISENYEGISKFMKAQNARKDTTLIMIVSCDDYDDGLTFEFNPALVYQNKDSLRRLLEDIKGGVDVCMNEFFQEEAQ